MMADEKKPTFRSVQEILKAYVPGFTENEGGKSEQADVTEDSAIVTELFADFKNDLKHALRKSTAKHN